MFKPLRNKKFVKFTMWGLVVVFALWGAGNVAMSKKNHAGTIFGKKISLQEYNREYMAVLNRAKMMYGDNLPKLEKFLNLKNQAWDRLILKYASKKKHIGASNREVIEKIASLPLFQRNNAFDDRLYSYIVTDIFHSSPRDFEESVRADIMIERLMSSVTKDIELSEEEIYTAYRAENETADVSYILISPDRHKDMVTTTDEELVDYYESNKENFKSPAAVNVNYIRIPFNDDKEEAHFVGEELAAEIKKNKTLKELSKEYNIELKETGFFSTNSKIPEIGLSYPFALAAISLKKNEISELVEITDSFCIMQLKSRKEPTILPLGEVKDNVKDMFVAKKAQELALSESENILLLINTEGKSLEAIAAENKLKLLNAKGITQKSYIEEIGPSDTFASTAFALKVGEIGGPVKTEKGYAIIKLDSIKPIEEEKFKEEKDTFSKTLLDRKRNEHFQGWFLNLKKEAKLKNNLT
ncbi:MAG: peptidyl-prolyl cis-trans isomerase [Candidatus Omnitrophica bacterium]|nr:peptidyl-prolyl cis-trans isomerase [Candidatus Omnitrophota bacterium]